MGIDTGLVLLLEDRRVELGIQPGLGRRPLEGHRQHDAAAGVPASRLAQVGLDVGARAIWMSSVELARLSLAKTPGGIAVKLTD